MFYWKRRPPCSTAAQNSANDTRHSWRRSATGSHPPDPVSTAVRLPAPERKTARKRLPNVFAAGRSAARMGLFIGGRVGAPLSWAEVSRQNSASHHNKLKYIIAKKKCQTDGVSPVCSNHSCNETLGHGVRNMILQDTTRKPTAQMIDQSFRRRRCLTPCPHQMPRIHGTSQAQAECAER